MLDPDVNSSIQKIQKKEITEYTIYNKLAERSNETNAEILRKIAADEIKHYNFLKGYTQKDFPPNQFTVFFYTTFCKLFGLIFTLKIMEGGEDKAQMSYDRISSEIPEVKKLFADEKKHENLLVNMIDEKKLDYIGSIVQGLNDALIGLMGQLAGLTFALQETRLIGYAGLIGGVAQFLSSSASEINIYFTNKTKENKQALNDSVISGIVYISTVCFLVAPYFIVSNHFIALLITLANVVVIIVFFTFYISVVRELSLRKIFSSMILTTLGIGLLSYMIGWIAKGILTL